MSLKEEDRQIMVTLELEKADSTFAEYEGLVEKEYWNTLANRLYYALFHAVSALLINGSREVTSHKGAAIRFHQYYVRESILSVDEGSFYSQMETLREKQMYVNSDVNVLSFEGNFVLLHTGTVLICECIIVC